ncbi:signal peptidase I [Ammoniphilus sp. CFH 90114]|uniref:signal peptidase I n=1 Tax=Ammoniphilus sp. CFH 90114 TaxID=2493665 RepID=UPI00100FDA1C|nr:signal peptidase I [Ammoniphilus sp. CFH 90114]RXT06338.1 signal peptidase I [Ammoniphilus sp. CFH 90114]
MSFFREGLSWAKALGVAAGISIALNVFVFQPTKVSGVSMEPTLEDNQKVFISKVGHTFNEPPDYGDIVIVDSRIDRQRTLMDDIQDHFIVDLLTRGSSDEGRHVWIKRIIGKPGDILEFKENGVVVRNGIPLEEPYIKEMMTYHSDDMIVVPEGHVFVMGDNRNHSNDSRFIGSIPLSNVLGKMMFQ